MIVLDNLRYKPNGQANSITRGYSMQHYQIRALLGLPIGKLPNTSTLPTLIGNVYVWMIARPNNARRQHRIFAACPNCSWYVPAGRLAQHLKACP